MGVTQEMWMCALRPARNISSAGLRGWGGRGLILHVVCESQSCIHQELGLIASRVWCGLWRDHRQCHLGMRPGRAWETLWGAEIESGWLC